MERVAEASTAGEIGLEDSSLMSLMSSMSPMSGRLCRLLSGVEGQRRTYAAAAACWPGRAGWEGEGRNVSLTYGEFSEVYVVSTSSLQLCLRYLYVVSTSSLSLRCVYVVSTLCLRCRCLYVVSLPSLQYL